MRAPNWRFLLCLRVGLHVFAVEMLLVMIIFVDPECGEDSSIMQILMALARVTALCEVKDDEPTEDMFFPGDA